MTTVPGLVRRHGSRTWIVGAVVVAIVAALCAGFALLADRRTGTSGSDREAQTAQATASVVNATGLEVLISYRTAHVLTRVQPDETLSLPLASPAGGCADAAVSATAHDDGRPTATTVAPEPLCDGDTWRIEPEDLWGADADGTGDPIIASPPLPTPDTATVTVTNNTDVEIVANLGLIEQVTLAPGESGELPLRVDAGGCEDYWLFSNVPFGPRPSATPESISAVCDGYTVVFTAQWITVLGPDGAVVAEIAEIETEDHAAPGTPAPMATVTMTNTTDVEILALVGLSEAMRLAPGESGEVPLRTDPGECVARRLFAEIPGREGRLQTEMMEVCDGDIAMITVDGITVS